MYVLAAMLLLFKGIVSCVFTLGFSANKLPLSSRLRNFRNFEFFRYFVVTGNGPCVSTGIFDFFKIAIDEYMR
jgi:hypothetical protein